MFYIYTVRQDCQAGQAQSVTSCWSSLASSHDSKMSLELKETIWEGCAVRTTVDLLLFEARFRKVV